MMDINPRDIMLIYKLNLRRLVRESDENPVHLLSNSEMNLIYFLLNKSQE